MKIRHIVMILIMGAVTAMGIYTLLPHLQSSFPASYANLELVGINDTYNTDQVIKFQFKSTGYGIPCEMPAITIYKSDQPSVIVFETKFPPLMCPIEGPTFFNVVYPSKNDTYSLTIKDASKYTIHVSFLNNELKKEFEITEQSSTYLSQTVDEWKNTIPEQLNNYYKKYKDTFYNELGSFLIKDEMKKELARQKIQNIRDDFKVFPGMSLDSLPPIISYDAVVNATDGSSYLLLGDVSANKIESIKIIKLAFDKDALNSLSTGKKPPFVNPLAETPKVVISGQSGISPTIEPSDLALDLDKDHLVTVHNDLTVPIEIYTMEENVMNWNSKKTIGPNEIGTIQFNKTGHYTWNVRSTPQGSGDVGNLLGYVQIAAFSRNHDDSTSGDKLKMAQVFVNNSDIPWSSTGLDNHGNLEISLYESVYHMIPDAQKYYAARAMQLIPFYVPVVVTSPSITGK